MRGRRVGEGGYDEEESYGEGHYFWEGGSILKGGIGFLFGFFWCGEF
jgi:hypothetical protein